MIFNLNFTRKMSYKEKVFNNLPTTVKYKKTLKNNVQLTILIQSDSTIIEIIGNISSF